MFAILLLCSDAVRGAGRAQGAEAAVPRVPDPPGRTDRKESTNGVAIGSATSGALHRPFQLQIRGVVPLRGCYGHQVVQHLRVVRREDDDSNKAAGVRHLHATRDPERQA